MKEVLAFLRDLEQNNNREWFHAHKERYLFVQKKWNAFCEELIREIGAYDADIAQLTLRDCTYRIYRDTRFSQDKSPYKTHFGAFLAKGGKKSMHAGYYFHVGTGTADGYPQAHMLAAGNYCYESAVVKILREDISYGWREFSEEILAPIPADFRVDMEGALKRVPRDYPADAPYADWMRMKSYCLVATLPMLMMTLSFSPISPSGWQGVSAPPSLSSTISTGRWIMYARSSETVFRY